MLVGGLALAPGCGGGGENPYESKKQSKSLGELKQAESDISAEEAEKRRKELGIRTDEEIAAENAAMFDKGAREYVKTRLAEYREFVAQFRGHLDKLEKEAAAWGSAKDPPAAFQKFAEGHKSWVKDFTERYDELTGNGAEGGNLQAGLGKAFRSWEEIDGELGPEIGKTPEFGAALAEVRKVLDETEKALGDIEKDESLKIDETYAKTKTARDAKKAADKDKAEKAPED